MNYTDATPIKELKPQPTSGLFVMPERIDKDGLGYYGEEASSVYKELRSLGADINYYTEKRTGVHRFGAKEEIITFVIGFLISDVPKSVTYDLLKAYILSKFKKRPKSVMQGKILISSEANGYSSWQEYEINGNADDAIKMIDKIYEIHSNELSTREKNTKRKN